ncbi:ES2 protein, putative [Plasmodium berghei]|uniref:ES2 protein, putative n=2 Tax=Plasmodium berghei TaxID=5821 RepID=A0A509AJ21_PLABA|nr:ES2 protein, putative [Plasmodium berghei ANKA]CXI45590.1 ES2 protein, putative [Plasmodium berghei]SCM22693.1 ES2 protein, putative [Plasmodium berghei]SCN25600.1 ES2 protein, putative [Plasmodium berghei]SCO60547.1 ES2 protein, putative [Plasmodium berghei]SCO62302.1 ES2 protein, putative [Plasmodium berghei]|eukprot:XP_034421718.1 ES2 protein, putative [Plasmodium berghei ANKA]
MENTDITYLEGNKSPNDKENNVETHRRNENKILLKDDKNLKIIRSKKKEKKEDDENEKIILFENNEIVEYDASYFKNQNNNIVLMEEDYLEVLEYLIEKTFFPDLHKLKNERGMISNCEFNNKECNDMNYKNSNMCPPSPNTFIDEDNSIYELMDKYRTDLSSDLQSCNKNNILSCIDEKKKKKIDKNSKYKLVVLPNGKKHKINLNIKLSDFQKLYISEDNKSFEYLLRNMKNKNIEKNMYSIIKRNEYNMKMDYIEECTKNGIKCDMLHMNKSENELYPMRISNGYKSSENILNRQDKNKNIIAYKNTRFSDEYNEDIKNQINQCEEIKQMKLLNRDRENKEDEMISKGVFNLLHEKNGYKYVNTPIIEAGKGLDKSPIITWGKIMSTPILLENNEEENDEKEGNSGEKNKFDYPNLNKESSNCDIDNYLKNEFALQKLNNREIAAEKLQNSLRGVKYNNKEILKKKRFNMLVKNTCNTSSRMSTTSFRSYVLSRKSQKRLNELSQKSSLASQILRKK